MQLKSPPTISFAGVSMHCAKLSKKAFLPAGSFGACTDTTRSTSPWHSKSTAHTLPLRSVSHSGNTEIALFLRTRTAVTALCEIALEYRKSKIRSKILVACSTCPGVSFVSCTSATTARSLRRAFRSHCLRLWTIKLAQFRVTILSLYIVKETC
ncbi:unnamed protein product [Ixodes hexagonus]